MQGARVLRVRFGVCAPGLPFRPTPLSAARLRTTPSAMSGSPDKLDKSTPDEVAGLAAAAAQRLAAGNAAAHSPRWALAVQVWKKLLTAEEFNVLRQKGTERAGTGEYNKSYPAGGVFVCRGCGAPLYKADTKFDSGCGWPACELRGGVGGSAWALVLMPGLGRTAAHTRTHCPQTTTTSRGQWTATRTRASA